MLVTLDGIFITVVLLLVWKLSLKFMNYFGKSQTVVCMEVLKNTTNKKNGKLLFGFIKNNF